MLFQGHLIHNIYYMLAFVYDDYLPQEVYDRISGEEFTDIYELLCELYLQRLKKQIKQGFYKEYIDITEDLSVVKGKIDLTETIKKRVSSHREITCEHDILSENNLYNRIILTAGQVLLRHDDILKEKKAELRNSMRFLSGIDPIDPKLIQWNLLRYTRNNHYYEELLNICRFILTVLLPTTEMGRNKFLQYWDDKRLSALFERFIRNYYQKYYPDLHADAKHVEWAASYEDRVKLPRMKSDITLTKGLNTLIIDTKFYNRIHETNSLYGNETLRSAHLYQIQSYVLNKAYYQKGCVSGMLLYAATTDKDHITDDFRILEHDFYIRTLDLNRNFSEIKKDLNKIADF